MLWDEKEEFQFRTRTEDFLLIKMAQAILEPMKPPI